MEYVKRKDACMSNKKYQKQHYRGTKKLENKLK